jgi:hypothetical protein
MADSQASSSRILPGSSGAQHQPTTTDNPGTDARSTACLPGRDRARERDGGDRGRRRSGSRSLAAFFAEYVSFAKAVPLLKSGSSKWIHENFPQSRGFSWQQGYGAFSVSISQQEKKVTYIHAQAQASRTG